MRALVAGTLFVLSACAASTPINYKAESDAAVLQYRAASTRPQLHGERIPAPTLVNQYRMCRDESAGMPTQKAAAYCGCVVGRMDEQFSLQTFATLSAEAQNRRNNGLTADKAAFDIPEIKKLAAECRLTTLDDGASPASNRMATCIARMRTALTIGEASAAQKCECFTAYLDKQLPDLMKDEKSRSLSDLKNMPPSEQAAIISRITKASQDGYGACGIPQNAATATSLQ